MVVGAGPFHEADDAGAVVFLGLVLHAVVHGGLFGLEHAFGEAHRVDEFRHRQLGHLLQRIEDVHHEQVLAGRLVELGHVRLALVCGAVVVVVVVLELTAEVGQLADEHQLDQREEGGDFGIAQVVLLLLLDL